MPCDGLGGLAQRVEGFRIGVPVRGVQGAGRAVEQAADAAQLDAAGEGSAPAVGAGAVPVTASGAWARSSRSAPARCFSAPAWAAVKRTLAAWVRCRSASGDLVEPEHRSFEPTLRSSRRMDPRLRVPPGHDVDKGTHERNSVDCSVMKSALGWTLLSREALKRAETQLRDDVQGVRDEVGFLALHQAYADRFFPGTSVLHTRLRYALFVPWLYKNLAAKRERRITAALVREEVALAGRLRRSHEEGVIGGRSYPEPTSQPASTVYWTALGAWRILRPLPSGLLPARSSVHRHLALRTSDVRFRDDDHQVLEETHPVFAGLPEPPKEWYDSREPLDFCFQDQEARFLRGTLLAVHRPGSGGEPSLLANLVDVPLRETSTLWDASVLGGAEPQDRSALQRARQVAALSAVGRGVYAALVEELRANDGRHTEKRHRGYLKVVVEKYREDALALNVAAVRDDAPAGINETILNVLRETQQWLKQPRALAMDLHEVYAAAERRRKGRRARLVRSMAGRRKRQEWLPGEHPEAEALHYRWRQVRRLLLDLQAAA